MKKLIAAAALTLCAGTSQAALVNLDSPLAFSFTGYNDVGTGVVTDGTFATLVATQQVKATFTFIGAESGYDNLITAFDLVVGGQSMEEDAGASVTAVMNAGDLLFEFSDSKGGLASNSGGRDYDVLSNPSFAVLTSNGNSIFGDYDFILGFNDIFDADADFDDYVVGLNLVATPLPAAAWLFGSALLGLGAVGRKRLARNKVDAIAA